MRGGPPAHEERLGGGDADPAGAQLGGEGVAAPRLGQLQPEEVAGGMGHEGSSGQRPARPRLPGGRLPPMRPRSRASAVPSPIQDEARAAMSGGGGDVPSRADALPSLPPAR